MVRRLQPTLEEAELGVKNGNSAALVYSKSGLESSGATCQSEALLVKVRSKEVIRTAQRVFPLGYTSAGTIKSLRSTQT
jgi:hypothetical protein